MIEDDSKKPVEAEYEIVSHGEEIDSNFKSSDTSHEETVFQSTKPISAWKAKLILWSILLGGIALVVIVLVFFAALFIYFFVPIMIALIGYYLIKKLFLK